MALWLLLFSEWGNAQNMTSASPGESSQFEIIPVPGSTYYWNIVEKPDLKNFRESNDVQYLSPRNQPVIKVKWVKSGTYFLFVTVISQGGCSNLKAYPVVVLQDREFADELVIPEAISPNGDGLNDQFIIKGLSAYPKSSLTILSRNGVAIYTNSDYQNDWEGIPNKGNLSGRPVPSGTYYYILYPGGTKRMIKGFIYVAG